MKLYLADIGCVKPGHIDLLPPERAEKARRYKTADDRKRCVLGGLMIKKFVGDTKILDNGFGKPVAENGVCFNLSHSGDYVLLAVGKYNVGCDIERIKTVKYEKMGRLVFCENELEKIKSSPDKAGEFYALWTKKEALLKCVGEGFHRPAKTVDVSADSFCENGKVYRMKTRVFADYVISVCTEGEDIAESIERVTFE